MKPKLSKRSEELLARGRARERTRERFWVRFGCGGVLGFVLGAAALFHLFPRPRRIGHAGRGLLDDGWFVLAGVVFATLLGAWIAARESDDDLLDFVESFLPRALRSPRARIPQEMEQPSAPLEETDARDDRGRAPRK